MIRFLKALGILIVIALAGIGSLTVGNFIIAQTTTGQSSNTSIFENVFSSEPTKETPAWDSNTRVYLSGIEEGISIYGTVDGVRPSDTPRLKIVAYIRTDAWYRHPRPGSYASIKPNGSWSIDTINRHEKPRKLALVLTTRQDLLEDKYKSLSELPVVFIKVYDLIELKYSDRL